MKKELTPMMRQYFEIKETCKDYILFYRLGDFYEMFFEDAILTSRELDLVLTARDCGQEEKAPMCGVPHHSCENYIARLIAKGYKIAICDQVEDPKSAKGIVKREIVRKITSGTVTENSMLDDKRNNFICAIYGKDGRFSVAFADITTGEVFASATQDKSDERHVLNEIGRFSPSEIIMNDYVASHNTITSFLHEKFQNVSKETVTYIDDDFDGVLSCLALQFTTKDNQNEQLKNDKNLCFCIDLLIGYIEKMQMCKLNNLRNLNIYFQSQFMSIDINSRQNLELCETLRTKEKKGSLLWVLDKTKTSMGARLLRSYLEKPLLNTLEIIKRQNAVEEFIKNYMKTDELIDILKHVNDIERITSKLVFNSATGRDLRALHQTLLKVPMLKNLLSEFSSNLPKQLGNSLDELLDVCQIIDEAIVEEPPLSLKDGGIIKASFNEEIEILRDASKGGKDKIFEIEQKERDRSKIKNLKIKYNRVFGYYIEISKSNLADVPEDYIRKQTLSNSERYITEELKIYESTVLGAEEKLKNLEYAILCDIRQQIAEQVHRIQMTAQAIAQIDVLCSLAVVAKKNRYVKPQITTSNGIDIKEGRHPVVEQMLSDELFVPNDVLLDCEENRFAIITGPNMAGKSTYMRQVALITVMAQIGSYVPCKSAAIGVCDSIFTRVGASDDLSSGRSTFMVEMSEMAYILKNATSKSLLILDEIGRGTSTFDGMSIARSVVEYICAKKPIGAKTLFATHYHELTELELLYSGIKNYNIAVKKRGEDITFLRKIIRGGADDSYGIEVAKLAGIPQKIISRAYEILEDLENNTCFHHKSEDFVQKNDNQISLSNISENKLTEKIREIDINTLTPIEAMNIIFELQKMID